MERRATIEREERDKKENSIFHCSRNGDFKRVKSLLKGGLFSSPINPNIQDEVYFNYNSQYNFISFIIYLIFLCLFNLDWKYSTSLCL